MHDEIRVRTPLSSSNEPSSQSDMNTVVGWFKSWDHAKKAIAALKRAGFPDETISFRDRNALIQENEEQQTETPATVMVAVQAKGERAAEAWSILEDVRMHLLGINRMDASEKEHVKSAKTEDSQGDSKAVQDNRPWQAATAQANVRP